MYDKHQNRARESLHNYISLSDIKKAKKREVAKKMKVSANDYKAWQKKHSGPEAFKKAAGNLAKKQLNERFGK